MIARARRMFSVGRGIQGEAPCCISPVDVDAALGRWTRLRISSPGTLVSRVARFGPCCGCDLAISAAHTPVGLV